MVEDSLIPAIGDEYTHHRPDGDSRKSAVLYKDISSCDGAQWKERTPTSG
jgi:hypothetical protein